MDTASKRALHSLEGLSLGDAFGQRFFGPERLTLIPRRELPPPQWRWTDDTEMALSVVEELLTNQEIKPDSLAKRFVRRMDLSRGYGSGAVEWGKRVAWGESWKDAASSLFEGQGSYGNGGAMRAAPIGAYFAGDPKRAAEEARKSAMVTHAHPEGQVGAMAVAVATALVSSREYPRGSDLLRAVAEYLPESDTRSGILRGTQLSPDRVEDVASVLGSGNMVSSQDTVPFALFGAAHHLGNYEDALWWTVAGLGDRDTTCAIVGGIVAPTVPKLPLEWLASREILPLEEITGEEE